MYCLILLLLFSASAMAESRALFVTVSRYQNGIENLPGVEIDRKRIQKIAELMGFTPANCKELHNATTLNIQRGLESWLIDGVTPQDSVLLYLSMHGGQTKDLDGDETKDHLDEFLVTADTAPYNKALRNYLLDDHLNQRLTAIPAKHILIIVDTCYSASMDKGVGPLQAKAVKLRGEPGKAGSTPYSADATSFDTSSRGIKGVGRDSRTFVVLAACKQHEKALTSPDRGSLFTMALEQAALRLASYRQPLRLSVWFEEAATILKGLNDSQHPQMKSERGSDLPNWFQVARSH
jgi:hypothetical protein